MAINGLDRQLLEAMFAANKKYEKLTGGYWLNHAPESFGQAVVALELDRVSSVCVYPECNPKKMKRDAVVDKRRGRPPETNQQQRFDLVVFWRNETRPRAIVELKITYSSMDSVVTDAEKIVQYNKEAKAIDGLRHGYLLVFNHASRNTKIDKSRQGKQTIESRFNDTTRRVAKLGFSLVNSKISRASKVGDREYFHGVALWRFDFA